MTTTSEMLAGLGILDDAAPASADEPTLDPSATAAPAPSESAADDESETISIAEALAQEQAGETVPQDAASADDQESAAEEPESEQSEVERIKLENEELKRENEALLAQDAEESFEEDWGEVIADGQDFYTNLINQVKERGYANGRSKTEVDAVIKHMIYDGNEIERLGAPAGTPGYMAWQQQTLVNYAVAKASRGQTTAQPSEIDRLTTTYHLTESDQVTLRKFANYPPEARELIAKELGAKNTQTTTKRQRAEEVAAGNVARRLTNQTAPGVPGPAPKAKPLAAPRNAAERRQLTELVTHRLWGGAGTP